MSGDNQLQNGKSKLLQRKSVVHALLIRKVKLLLEDSQLQAKILNHLFNGDRILWKKKSVVNALKTHILPLSPFTVVKLTSSTMRLKARKT